MVRAIIFDCFGVLATDGWLPFKRRYFGKSGDLYERATELNHSVDAGLMRYDDYLTAVAKLAGIPGDEARRQIEDNVPNEVLFRYIQAVLKGKYRLGILSNAADNWLDELFSPQQVALFEATALSYETGVIKPNARAYEIIAERLGAAIGDCVLVDDQERYCTAAREAGMQAIWYHNFAQMKAELEAALAANKKR